MKNSVLAGCAIGALGLLSPVRADVASADEPLHHLSLEDLGSLEVTTVSKVPETLWRVPAAISVLTGDDIRRNGATTLAEALRMVPGVEVARIDGGHWSVGIRGFGDQFSKSVLVLVDGRTVYNPLFAGVFWAVQNVPLEDVDRIEVIRGPGGTVWGANAVQGVINVITRKASETVGVLAKGSAGTVNRARGLFRYGAQTTDSNAYRVYGQYLDHAPQRHAVGDPEFDNWHHGQGGFRFDGLVRDGDQISLHGDVYSGSVGQSVALGSFSPPEQKLFHQPLEVSGGNLVAQWSRDLGTGSVEVQTYYDRTRYSAPQFRETRDTVDFDLVHHKTTARQEIVGGFGFRLSSGRFEQTEAGLDVVPHRKVGKLFSVFLQDTVAVAAERVWATLGAKVEHNEYTGVEVQPSVRLLWRPRRDLTAWAAISRAVRTPSRLERDIVLNGFLAAAPPTYVEIVGNPEFDSEVLLAYEAGMRALVSPTLYVDVAAFHNVYDNLEAFGAGAVLIKQNPFRVVLQFPFANGVRGSGDGIEISADWRPTTAWRIRSGYSLLSLKLENTPGNTDVGAVKRYEGSSPRHQGSVESMLDLPAGFQLDGALRYVSALPGRDVPSYLAFDVRLGWRKGSWEWSLSGWNLGDASHPEFGHDPPPTVEIRRSIMIAVAWSR